MPMITTSSDNLMQLFRVCRVNYKAVNSLEIICVSIVPREDESCTCKVYRSDVSSMQSIQFCAVETISGSC